jgi:hypothetical protein
MQDLLKANWLFLVVFTALAFAVVSCGDDNNKTTGPNGGGMPISADNIAGVNAQVGATLGTVLAKGPGTHQGANSGEVTVTQNVGKAGQTTQVSFTLVFKKYSDDGKLIYDGTIIYELNESDSFYEIDVEFTGDYTRKVKGAVSAGDNGTSGSWEVNGQTLLIG